MTRPRTRCKQIDVATGAAKVLAAGPGLKEAPFRWPAAISAFCAAIGADQGIFYASGEHGPSGKDIRVASWSPDGKQLVYSRLPAYGSRIRAAVEPQSEVRALCYRFPARRRSRAGPDCRREAHTTARSTCLWWKATNRSLDPETPRPDPGAAMVGGWQRIVVGVGLFSSFLDFTVGNKKPVDPVNGGAQVALLNADGSDFAY